MNEVLFTINDTVTNTKLTFEVKKILATVI